MNRAACRSPFAAQKITEIGWGGGSAAKGAVCLSRGHGFDFQLTIFCNTNSRGSSALFWIWSALHTHGANMCMHAQHLRKSLTKEITVMGHSPNYLILKINFK